MGLNPPSDPGLCTLALYVFTIYVGMAWQVHGLRIRASAEQLQARLGLRRSNAAQPHRNKKREAKRPGKGSRNKWKKEYQ